MERNSNVNACYTQEDTLQFKKCLEEKRSNFIFDQIYLKPYKSSELITSYGIYQPIFPEDGAIGIHPYNVSMTFNNAHDYQFSLYDKNYFFPTLNYLSVPRTVFRISRSTTHYQIFFQVGF